MRLHCHRCRRDEPFDVTRWRCPCGGVLQITGAPSFDVQRVREEEYSMWRYREGLPLSVGASPVTLGEGWTPLIDVQWKALKIQVKMESLNPTGSFKDRGAALLFAALRRAGVKEVVEDSSGNAGAALEGLDAGGEEPLVEPVVVVLTGSGLKSPRLQGR